MKRPRPFSHRPIFIDARRDRLAEIEQRARRELDMENTGTEHVADLHGVFSRSQQHANHRKERGRGLSMKSMLLLILLLLLIWRLLQ